MESFLVSFKDILWDNILLYMCLGAGIFFSLKTGFLQLTHVREMIRLLIGTKGSKKGISSFQAFTLAISGRVGTGNIVGVATAIAYGGPGAVFWMWVVAFLAASTAFIESALGQLYKKEVDGHYRGGPAYYIEKGLGIRWFALLFAVITILSEGVLLPGIQSNAIAETMQNAFEVPPYVSGLAIIVLLAVIIIGGVKRLGKTAELVVPFMAVGYIIMAMIVIGMNISEVPAMFKLIVGSAFGADAAFGGILGAAISWGVRRSIYSNEAGQGTAPHAAAAAEVDHPAQQGLVQAFSVYIDTLLVCSATALIILFTGQYNVTEPGTQNLLVENIPGLQPTGFTQAALQSQFPTFGANFVAIALFFFAFTTIMAYYYYSETNVAYLYQKKNSKPMIWILRILFLGATMFGTLRSADLAWTLGDIGVGIMAFTNLIAIYLLRKPAIKLWKDYKERRKRGELHPQFKASDIGIDNTDEWKD